MDEERGIGERRGGGEGGIGQQNRGAEGDDKIWQENGEEGEIGEEAITERAKTSVA